MKNRLVVFLVCAVLLLVAVGMVLAGNQPTGSSLEVFDLKVASEVDQPTACVDVTVTENNEDVTKLDYTIGEFITEKVQIHGNEYFRIVLGEESNIMERGVPDFPKICRSIIIPDDAKMEVQVTASEFVEYQMPIAPSRGFISRNLNPDDVPYEFSETYDLNEFYPHNIAELGSPYILRDFRGITVTVYPFVYNPRTQTLRVYTHVVLEVRNIGLDYKNAKIRDNKKCSQYFTEIHENHFLNYESYSYDAVDEHGRMIVICYGGFLNAIQPYVDWKRQKGLPTDIYDIADIGVTAEDIKNFIQTEYDAHDGLTFVQLVGDAAHIPTFLISRDFCEGLATSDASYALLEGDDSYPDIFVGRFSAETVAEVETQVERTIYYERDIVDGDWLHKGTGVGSAWGEGYGYMGLRDRDLVEVLRQMLLGYTYTEVDQLYEWGEPPFGIVPVPVPEFMNAINEGKGIVIVEGHADCEASFMIPPGTPSPGDIFTTDSVYLLVNDYMLPFITIGAPYLGNFQIDLAFPEAWLRATNSVTGAPIGAIAVYASSVDLDYASPQAAQHEMVELLVNDNMNTIGGLMYNGACYSIDLYGARGEKTFKSYHIFGDVSLQVRTDTPSAMTVLHDPIIPIGSSSFEVTVVGVEDALCAISRDYVLLGYGYTDETGHTVVEFDEPLTGEEPLDLVVTAYNKISYITQITVAEGAYVVQVVSVNDTIFPQSPCGFNVRRDSVNKVLIDVVGADSTDSFTVDVRALVDDEAYRIDYMNDVIMPYTINVSVGNWPAGTDSLFVYAIHQAQGDTCVPIPLIIDLCVPPQFLRGDANGDGVIDIADATYLINYLFINGPAPDPLAAGDATGGGEVDIADVVYLINYLFIDGPPPEC
ncbi:MAG: hypothetical protein KAW16_04655 [candidate division Zixibacteria bacterium]|nr:hypothetical protein [candidate division Zixibacteria bacterium]